MINGKDSSHLSKNERCEIPPHGFQVDQKKEASLASPDVNTHQDSPGDPLQSLFKEGASLWSSVLCYLETYRDLTHLYVRNLFIKIIVGICLVFFLSHLMLISLFMIFSGIAAHMTRTLQWEDSTGNIVSGFLLLTFLSFSALTVLKINEHRVIKKAKNKYQQMLKK